MRERGRGVGLMRERGRGVGLMRKRKEDERGS